MGSEGDAFKSRKLLSSNKIELFAKKKSVRNKFIGILGTLASAFECFIFCVCSEATRGKGKLYPYSINKYLRMSSAEEAMEKREQKGYFRLRKRIKKGFLSNLPQLVYSSSSPTRKKFILPYLNNGFSNSSFQMLVVVAIFLLLFIGWLKKKQKKFELNTRNGNGCLWWW